MDRVGRIVKQISNDYWVLIDDETIVCKARGKFRKLNITPLVGDMVTINYDNQYIIDVKERKNELIRPRISNVDMALVVTSVQIPAFSTNLLDKLLTIIEYNNIKPTICITKYDLIDEQKKQELIPYFDYYKSIGYQLYFNTDENLKEVFKNKITVFAGQSGAGKSALLNSLDSTLNIKTGEVSKALGRGKHTTRHTELISTCDGLIADTPGFSSVSFEDMSESDIRDNFIEFNEHRDLCQYKTCMHAEEPGCEIKRMVESGTILQSRYDNYLKFIGKR